MKGICEFVLKRLHFSDFAFPNDKHSPAKLHEFIPHTLVASPIPANLADPVFTVGLWRPRATSAFVAMPKTAVNEDSRAPARKNDIRLSRQSAPAKAKAQPSAMKQVSDFQLRTSVRPFHSAHDSAAFGGWLVGT